MNRKLIILVVGVVAVVAVVAVLVVPLLLGDFGPPVDVYARPTPSISEEPEDLLPLEVAGFNLIIGDISLLSWGKRADGHYEGGILIEILRFSTSAGAAARMDEGISAMENSTLSFASGNESEEHWFATTGSGLSAFTWRKGVWIFLVRAPNEALRNQVVEELPF